MITKFKNRFFAYVVSAFAMSVVVYSATVTMAIAAPTSEVAVIVNGNPITNYDIQRRKAFLQLQRRSGNLNKLAREELIDEMLRRVEMKKRNIDVSAGEVNRAFADFAERNNLTEEQLVQMLNQAGVTPEHFKMYIMVQIGWGRLLSARYQAEGVVSEQEAVRRIQKNGGVKPTANEYLLKQAIFVIPQSRRGAIIGRRRQEANALRARVNGCDNLQSLVSSAIAKGTRDVTIRDLGRILEPELPTDWVRGIKATPTGKATPALDTERGVEFLVICSKRQVSNDRVAQLVFSQEDNKNSGKRAAALEKKYMKELRDSARIQKP